MMNVVTVKENKKSNVTKSHKLLIPSSGAKKLCGAGNLKLKTSTMGSCKRGLPGVGDGQKEKRRKMDRCMTHQCSSILKQLMTHPAGWVFNQPVDPVNLNIPDYFSVITQPMDLGTIKTKLQNTTYSKVEEFAADVRLTFSNAMVYNPPPSNVNFMAKELSNIFNTRWNCLEAKWNHQHANVKQGCKSSGRSKNTNNPGKTPPLHASLLPKRLMSAEEKQKLRKQLLEVSKENSSPHLQGFLKKIGFNRQREERIEVDIDAFDDETLWELKRIIRISLTARAAKAGSVKKADNSQRLLIGMIVSQGTDSGNRSATGSANVYPPLNFVTPKCGSCGSMRCQCSLRSDFACASSRDLSSERSLGQDHFDASRKDCEAKSLSASQMSKSDPDSDGWTPPIDIQLSPKKVLRAAMLKSRFADTILKAKQKTLLDHSDEADPVKMQQEKERLERQQLEGGYLLMYRLYALQHYL